MGNDKSDSSISIISMIKEFSVAPDAVVEVVGADVFVHLPGSSEVIRLSGATAEAFLAIQAGEQVDSLDKAVHELVAIGVVQSRGLSRRGLVKAGAIGAGAGITVLAMPSIAAASSVEPGLEEPGLEEPGLTGILFAETWNDTVRYPAVSSAISATDPDWVAAILGIVDAPYSVPLSNDVPVLDGGSPMQGTVTSGGQSYTAHLYVYEGQPFWFFLGDTETSSPASEANFELTFSYGGDEYTVVPAEG